jgi:arylsulfatase A-like enzyme
VTSAPKRVAPGTGRVALPFALHAGLAVSFFYFRAWAWTALRDQPAFLSKWALGFIYDLAAYGACCFLLSVAWAWRERPGPWIRVSALLLVLLNWGNFEVQRHIGQPFLPQALGILALHDAFDPYGAQLIGRSLHLGHALFALVLPGALAVLPPLGRRHSEWPRRRLSFGLGALALSSLTLGAPWLFERLHPVASSHPRTLVWNFYWHGAFHWPAFLLSGDEAAGEPPGQPLSLQEVRAVAEAASRYFEGTCAKDSRYPLVRRRGSCHPDETPRVTPVKRTRVEGVRKNVVFVHLESFRAASFDGLGDVWTGVTPRLTSLMKESAHFTRAFTNHAPTDRSVTSLMCSVPVPGLALSRLHRPRPRLACLPGILKNVGYRGVRMSGIPAGFQKLGQFFADYGMDESYGSVELEAHFPYAEGASLGAHGYDPDRLYDERLFHAAQSWIVAHRERRPNQPFFLVLETMTNHLPWHLPASRRMPLATYLELEHGAEVTGTEETTRMHRTMRLTDDYVGEFMDWFQSQEDGQLAAESLVVFYSDHPPWFPEPEFDRYPQVVKESWIPLFLWGVPPELARRFDHPVSLIDVAPTVLALTHTEAEHAFFGKNLFDADAPRWFEFSPRPGQEPAYFASGERWLLPGGTSVRLSSDLRFSPLEGPNPPAAAAERAAGLLRDEERYRYLLRYTRRALLADRALVP